MGKIVNISIVYILKEYLVVKIWNNNKKGVMNLKKNKDIVWFKFLKIKWNKN